MKRPSGRHPLEIQGVRNPTAAPVVRNFTASVRAAKKSASSGATALGKTTLLRSLIANAPGA